MAETYSGRGVAKDKLNDYSGAIADWKEAIRLNPHLRAQLQPGIDKAEAKLKGRR